MKLRIPVPVRPHCFLRHGWYRFAIALVVLAVPSLASAHPAAELPAYTDRLDSLLVDYYASPETPIDRSALALPSAVKSAFHPAVASEFDRLVAEDTDPATTIGTLRGRLQQAITLAMADAVRRGDLNSVKAWRVQLLLPRGVSAVEGALLLETLGGKPDKQAEAARLLVREAITWQTTRVRQLLDQAGRSTQDRLPMPGRLRERVAEAIALADLPRPLVEAAGIESLAGINVAALAPQRAAIAAAPWDQVKQAYAPLRQTLETSLPSLLTPAERTRRERLLLKLIILVPREYEAGVREGVISVPFEYREAVAFTAQARQIVGELAPLWLADKTADRRSAVDQLEAHLARADDLIATIAASNDVEDSLKQAQKVLTSEFGINLSRRGTTADIVDEVMLEVRSLLSQSLAAALQGKWKEAEHLRLEAYTTFDPELEARLMPRDPQLALDIERLLLDGIDHPGVKELLDRRAGPAELEAAYARVGEAMDRAAALLRSSISPSAAAINAASIVLREGLEGLLVIIAIFAGLRGKEHARRRRLFWVGILGSLVATAITWILSQTIITSLRAYGEYIEVVTGLVAIGVLLLITNWLFHQVYWRQWITTLKTQASESDSAWALITVGFAVGYREGFETVLFLQSLILDAGGGSVAIGVSVGSVVLLALGIAGLYFGLKLPYFKLLMLTAILIGLVLVTFTGGTVRALQTVGWLPVHRLTGGSWPQWTGTWLGLYNTWESVLGQIIAATIVLGTWRVVRFKAKRKSAKRAHGVTTDIPTATANAEAAH